MACANAPSGKCLSPSGPFQRDFTTYAAFPPLSSERREQAGGSGVKGLGVVGPDLSVAAVLHLVSTFLRKQNDCSGFIISHFLLCPFGIAAALLQLNWP